MPQGNIRQYRKISIDDARVGMYLGDVFNSQGVLLLSANIALTSNEQIESLRRQGVSTAFIDISKGLDIESSELNDLQREKAYYQELEKAIEVHRATVKTAREALSAVRMGRSFVAGEIEKAADGIVESILRNPDALVSLAQIKGYDEYTYIHSVNVGILITSLAHSMGYDRGLLVEAGVGGILHDIGKMWIPEKILNKPGKYTDAEFSIMKKHTDLGLEIIKDRKNISDFSRTVIAEHHERYNGKGYPKGLKGDRIHEIGLIAAVADVYDAMTTDRVYRAAWTPQRALAMIFKGCDLEYSRRVVELFTKHLGIYPVGSFVKLHSGEMGVVTHSDKGELLAPDVLILFSSIGARLNKPVYYKLSHLQKEPNGAKYKIEMSLNPKAYNVDVTQYIQGKLPF